jgi:vacuolar protein sorting-associated protein 72
MSDQMSDIESERDGDSSSSSSEEEPEEVIRSRVPALAVTRERRANAGSKMANLIQDYAALTQTAENDNEFYNTAYGGFDEDGEDEEFDENQEEADDELDSDFDAEEVDDANDAAEPADDQDEESGRKRTSRRKKEAYEISADLRNKKAAQNKSAAKAKPKPKSRPPAVMIRKTADSVTKSVVEEFVGKRSLRERKRVVRDEDEEPAAKKSRSSRTRSRKSKGKAEEKTVWTQEELLAEAKETERENLASLQKYQLLELEKNEAKKRMKKTSREIAGPFIRYVSTSMPLIVEEDSDSSHKQPAAAAAGDEESAGVKTERTFITFSDEHVFNQNFTSNRSVNKRRSGASDIKRGQAICPISNLRARYFDPVTQVPFASSISFHILRETYCNQLAAMYGNKTKTAESSEGTTGSSKKMEEVQAFLEWRSQNVRRNMNITSSSEK